MKTILLSGTMALALAFGAAGARADGTTSFKISGGVGSSTSAGSYGSVDGGGMTKNGGFQATTSQSSGYGFATTQTGLSHGTTFTSTGQTGSGVTFGTGSGGFDYAAGDTAHGWSGAYLNGSYSAHNGGE